MTHAMVKGSNIQLGASAVRVVLRWSPAPGTPDIDVSALLLDADGRVRSDEDFVFYNQPRHPSGLVRHQPKDHGPGVVTDTVEADLGALDPSVECVLIAASADTGSFGQVPDLHILVYDLAKDREAEAIAEYHVVPETGDESALDCGELYRRGGAWKFRAVGQGYTTGLVGLATAFGITVDDGGRDEPAGGSTAAQDSAPESTAAPAVPAASAPAPPSPGPAAPPPPPPQPPQAPGAGYGYPPPHQPSVPEGYGYPPPRPAQAPQPQNAGAYGYPPQSGGYGYPPQPPVPPAPSGQQGYGYGYPPPPQGAAHPACTHPQGQPRQDTGPNGACGGPEAQEFTLPPQGPQFQPDRSGRR